jgi:hypothetical protein
MIKREIDIIIFMLFFKVAEEIILMLSDEGMVAD